MDIYITYLRILSSILFEMDEKATKKKEAKIEKISWQTKNSNMKSNKK